MKIEIKLTPEETKAIKTRLDPWGDHPEKEPTPEEIEEIIHSALKNHLHLYE